MKNYFSMPRLFLATFFLICVGLCCISCKNNQIQLSGKFENGNKRYMLLSRIEPNDVVFLDTVLLFNGNFLHSITTEEIGIYLLKYNDSTLLSFIAQNGDKLLFSGNADNLNKTYNIQGNEETQLLLETRRKLNQFYDKTKEWTAIFLQHTYQDDYEQTSVYLDSLYFQEFDAHKEYLTQFIHKHKGKLVTLVAFYQKIGMNAFFNEQKDHALLQEIYDGLILTYPNSIYVADLKDK